jgi:uncharacterized protein with HEPN domain
MSKRTNKELLSDVIEAIDKIMLYTADMDFEDFARNDLVKDAVARNFTIIGEASSRVEDSFREQYPDVEWQKIRGLRNRVVHDYVGIDYRILWMIREENLPDFKVQIEKIISKIETIQ